MPIEKRPTNPLPRSYVPEKGTPYKVKTDDDWHTVAKAHGIPVQDLIHFNFHTRNPAEINYYLRVNVGCTKSTRDRKNWMFTSDASPGVIYLPPKADRPSPPMPPGPPIYGTGPQPISKPAERSGVWFGLGVQGGGHLAVFGKDTVEALLYSLEGYQDRFWLNIDGWRLGPGLGGSVGLVFVVATGAKYPSKFSGLKVTGFDFQANLGGKWGDLAKGLKGLGAVAKFARAGKIIDKTISMAEWEKVRDLIWNLIKAGQINAKSSSPEVNVMGIPGAGLGLELSAYYGTGTVTVHGVTLSH
jgi:hypothetical protein